MLEQIKSLINSSIDPDVIECKNFLIKNIVTYTEDDIKKSKVFIKNLLVGNYGLNITYNIDIDNFWMTVVLNLIEREHEEYYGMEYIDYLDEQLMFSPIGNDLFEMNSQVSSERLSEYLEKYPSSTRKVAKRLGVSDEFIKKCKELDSVDLGNYVKNPKVISRLEQNKIENTFYKDLKAQFPELAEVKLVKSSSGFSVRMVIRVNLEFNGKVISTDANLRDRTGLACEMLVGLKDM
jgi:hypothetical protein